MSVTVKFFANLRESTGLTCVTIDYRDSMTINDAWAVATNGMKMPARYLTAVNMEHESSNAVIRDNDEVAFFPMVSGG